MAAVEPLECLAILNTRIQNTQYKIQSKRMENYEMENKTPEKVNDYHGAPGMSCITHFTTSIEVLYLLAAF